MQRSLIATVILSGALVALSGSVQAEAAMSEQERYDPLRHAFHLPTRAEPGDSGGRHCHLLEAVGTTQNLKGEPMLDKMAARCTALNVELGDKKYIDGACALTDKDGDVIFSTFDTRDLDASQPDMKCGTHIITGGSGKYAGSPDASPLPAMTCPNWLEQAAISPWTFRTTRRGKSSPRLPQNAALTGLTNAAPRAPRRTRLRYQSELTKSKSCSLPLNGTVFL